VQLARRNVVHWRVVTWGCCGTGVQHTAAKRSGGERRRAGGRKRVRATQRGHAMGAGVVAREARLQSAAGAGCSGDPRRGGRSLRGNAVGQGVGSAGLRRGAVTAAVRPTLQGSTITAHYR
jgi:hypothetical protein